MKRTKQGSIEDVVREVLAEPYVREDSKPTGYLENWRNQTQRGGMLRRMTQNYFLGSLDGHSLDDVEDCLRQFISDARRMGKEAAAERLFLRLMPPTLTNGGAG